MFRRLHWVTFTVLAGVAQAQTTAGNGLTAVRHWTLNDATRVVIETTKDFEYRSDRVPNPDRLFFDLPATDVRLGKRGLITFPVNDARLKQIRVAETQPGVARVVFDLGDSVAWAASQLANPPRLIVELRNVSPEEAAAAEAARAAATATAAPMPAPEPVLAAPGPVLARETSRTSAAAAAPKPAKATPLPPPPKPARMGASHSMTRVLGLKLGRIVLDPGHGGHDTGTIGPGGLMEKDLVLDIAKRLGELIETRLAAEVIYTRQDDTFLPLEQRTGMANEQKADLFLSIHANSSPATVSSGVETYYLNFTTDTTALAVAARENAGSQSTVYELQNLVQKIALQDKVDESRQFAERVQQSLHLASVKANPRSRNRGVRKAPFVVLIGARMPSILAEIGFLSNPRDEGLFQKPEFRQRIAEGLYKGLAEYAATLSQFQVAQN